MRVIVGSSNLELSSPVISQVVSIISSMDPGEIISIRSKSNGEPTSPLEGLVWEVMRRLERKCVTVPGQGNNFIRDYYLVQHADAVYAFFSPGREMEGGTGHVVKAALDREVKVEAYGVDPQGSLTMIGSEEGRRGVLRPSSPEMLRRLWEDQQS